MNDLIRRILENRGGGSARPERLARPGQQQLPGAAQAKFVICDQTIEIAIKRLKSIWRLDHLRAKDHDLAQTYLLGKLLGAWRGDALTGKARGCLPAWFGDLFRPVSLWRLQQVWFEWLHRAVVGLIPLQAILSALPRLERYLRDSPRKKRRQQLAYVLDWLQRLSPATHGVPLTISATVEYEMVLS